MSRPLTDKEYLDQLNELSALQDEWRVVFGEDLLVGFDVTEAQIPLLHECLRGRDQAPLTRYLESLTDQRIHP